MIFYIITDMKIADISNILSSLFFTKSLYCIPFYSLDFIGTFRQIPSNQFSDLFKNMLVR